MVWQPLAPDGSKSVKQNNPILLDNTAYTETSMNKDHYWNIGVNEDGHHKYAQMVKAAADPAIAAGMDLVYYSKKKTALEAPAQQDVQPYAENSTQIMQLLGMRACVVFDAAGAIKYAHNINTVVRVGAGDYTITFAAALPSENYLVLGGAIRDIGTRAFSLLAGVQGANAIGDVKTVALCKVHTTDIAQANKDPLQAWFVFFGG